MLLYTLVWQRARWLVRCAMIGGLALLADGMLTPAVTVSTAIEGLKGVHINGNILIDNVQQVIWVSILMFTSLSSIQRFGTDLFGKAFGPMLFVWFTSLGVLGFMLLCKDWSMCWLLNPY